MTTPATNRPAVAFAIIAAAFIGLGVAGDTLTSLMINGSGVIQNKQTLTHSNALRVVSAPSQSNDVVRWQDLTGATNSLGGLTNGLAGTNYVDATVAGATNAIPDIMRVPLFATVNNAPSSNQWSFNPYTTVSSGSLDGNDQYMLVPSKYRYIKTATVILNGLAQYGETNWLGPTVKFGNPLTFQAANNAGTFEFQHNGGGTFAGWYNAWTNAPAAWTRTLYNSGASRKGIVWVLTNSIALPAPWWTNATTSVGNGYFFISMKVLNANTFSMSNAFPPSGYIEFSTTP